MATPLSNSFGSPVLYPFFTSQPSGLAISHTPLSKLTCVCQVQNLQPWEGPFTQRFGKGCSPYRPHCRPPDTVGKDRVDGKGWSNGAIGD